MVEGCTSRIVTSPIIPLEFSEWLKMWQWISHFPGLRGTTTMS